MPEKRRTSALDVPSLFVSFICILPMYFLNSSLTLYRLRGKKSRRFIEEKRPREMKNSLIRAYYSHISQYFFSSASVVPQAAFVTSNMTCWMLKVESTKLVHFSSFFKIAFKNLSKKSLLMSRRLWNKNIYRLYSICDFRVAFANILSRDLPFVYTVVCNFFRAPHLRWTGCIGSRQRPVIVTRASKIHSY